MAKEIQKAEIIFSLFWKLMERGGTQGVQFFIQIILARLLLPAEFGMIALISIFITVANVFVQSGFNTALIQKKDTDETDFSSIFFLSLLFAILIYFILFFSAPLIAIFYNEPQIIDLIRILSITLFFGAINSIQNAVIAKKMLFKKLFFSSLGGIIVSGLIGILMAYFGYGVWALVAQQLTNQLIITVILWFILRWRPRFLFSFTRVKALFTFGWKILVSALIDTIDRDLRSLIIGKIFSPTLLGYYHRGQQFPAFIVTNVNGSIQSVMLPALSSKQDNINKVKDMVRRSIVTSTFLIFPIMVGLAVIAEPLVKILLTDKWLPSVPFLQIFCASYALWPIHTANLQAINALGRSDIYLKLEILKKIVGLAILGLTVFNGIYAIAFGVLISGIVSAFINAFPNLKLLNYSYKEQLKDIMPSLLLSLSMGCVGYSIEWLGMSAGLTITIQVFICIIFYFSLAKIFRLECFTYILKTCKEMFKFQFPTRGIK